ncbi:hypothetical protein HK099_000630 [Clydaea vesicula]|uniref:Putative CHCC zinc finger domain-containing protein n=1 Tax=Clydaea vesicula TaxID=447962 RepID=A0AAD5TV42_9FUNG|nr:hypothetical protein HK099_000630 [Clydaea vesicula]
MKIVVTFVLKVAIKCSHEVKVSCSEDVKSVECGSKCDKTLSECMHSCLAKCGTCKKLSIQKNGSVVDMNKTVHLTVNGNVAED